MCKFTNFVCLIPLQKNIKLCFCHFILDIIGTSPKIFYADIGTISFAGPCHPRFYGVS